MTSIYDIQHKAFGNVTAYAICKVDAKNNIIKVATIQLKFPKDGAGRLWCYFHVLGLEMVRAYAGGYGYDKRSAAIAHAIVKCMKDNVGNTNDNIAMLELAEIALLCSKIDVYGIEHCLHGSNYKLIQAV